MAGREMTSRILTMYDNLRTGREIQKLSFCMEHQISERTFDRDIERIRLFMSEDYRGDEVKYCPERECYIVPGIMEKGELSILEFTIIIKILKGIHALEKNEFVGLMHSLQSVTDRRGMNSVRDMILNEANQYIGENRHGAFLKLFGDLQKCINDRNIIRIRLESVDDTQRWLRFCPVSIEYFMPGFYLLGYQAGESGKLTVLQLEDIESFQTTTQRYSKDIGSQYTYKEGCRLMEYQRKKKEGNIGLEA